MAAAASNDQQAAASSSSRGDAGSSSRPLSVAEAAAAASQQRHQAALRERYELQSLRGKGSFAKVWEARHRRTGHKVAIKIISHAKMLAQGLSSFDNKITQEIRVMRLLSQGHHPNVIRFYEAIATHRHTYIVMELADSGGQLYDHVLLQGRLPDEQAHTIFRQLAAAVLFCHPNMVAHRDLKMENVLLTNTNTAVKVVDFGFSKLYSDTKPMRKRMGSPEYAAPELLGRATATGYVGPQVDVWSCGVILYGMLYGGLPFAGDDISELARNVRRGDYLVPPWVTDDARDLIAGMLIVRPHKRMTMAEVMAHRWLRPADMPAYLAMPPPDVHAAASKAMMAQVDEAVVEQVVTRHGFDRSSLLESLHRQHHQQQEDEAAVAYQLVLASMSDAATRYLSMRRPPPAPPEQMDGGVLQWLLHDCACPRLTMQRIAAALDELGITIVSFHTRRNRIKCRADVVVPAAPAAAGDGLERNNNILDSLSAAVFFKIQVYKTTGELEFPAAGSTSTNNSSQQRHQGQGERGPQYVVHLNRTQHLRPISIQTQTSKHLAATATVSPLLPPALCFPLSCLISTFSTTSF